MPDLFYQSWKNWPDGTRWKNDIQHFSSTVILLAIGMVWTTFLTYLCFLAAARSLCLLFLNQFPTCVGESDVAWANSRFLAGFGYEFFKYASLSTERVRSLKQCDFCSPSQIVPGKGYFFLTRYLSTKLTVMRVLRVESIHVPGPRGRPRDISASL